MRKIFNRSIKDNKMYIPISIANTDYEFRNLLVEDILELSKIQKNYFEQQLSLVIKSITSGKVNPLHLTCQERYAIFLSYLGLTTDHNGLQKEVDVNLYLAENLDNFNAERMVDEYGVSVRHLMGVEAHALEIGCSSTSDWILGVMAITIGCEQLPPIDQATSLAFSGKMIQSRMQELQKMDVLEFNRLMASYLELQNKQHQLVSIAFDNGIVLEKFSLRGADDAPMRFQPSTAFKGYAKNILSIAIRENTELQQ